MLSSRRIHHIMWAAVVVLLFVGHVRASPPSAAKCESLTNDVVAGVLKGLNLADAEYVRREIEGKKAHWTRDRSFTLVREAVAEVPNVRSLISLEVAGGRGPGYDSLWFVDAGDDVFEFSTSYARAGYYWRGTIPREQWNSYTKYLDTVTESDLQSIVSTTSVDAPIYFMCLLLTGREAALVVELNPHDAPQYSIIARTLALARSKVVPREMQSHPAR